MGQNHNRTPITNSNVDTKEENHEKIHCLPKRTRENLVGGGTNKESAVNVSSGTGTKKLAHKRLEEAVTQVLCSTGRMILSQFWGFGCQFIILILRTFNENQYPKRDVKEILAKELGLTLQQVSKWFNNARWMPSSNHSSYQKFAT